MVKKSSLLQIYDYFVIYYAVACSGNPFFIYRDPIKHFIVLMILVIIRRIANKRSLLSIRKNEALFLMGVLTLLVVSMTLNADYSLQSYINTFSRLVGALLITKAFKFEDFAEKYVKLITFLAAASVVLFFANQRMPQIANVFGELPNAQLKEANLDYRTYVNGGFLYTFIVSYGYGTDSIWAYTRNNGIFWEPGAYQFFLNLALVFLLEKCDVEKKKWALFILIITVLSTGSSTGMITLFVILIGYRKKIGVLLSQIVDKYRTIILLFIAVAAVFMVRYGEYLFYAADKIVRETNNPGYILERIGLSYIDEVFNGLHFLFGYGITGVATLEAAHTLNNTYAYYMFAFGIPYMVVILIRYLMKYKEIFVKAGIAFLALLLGLTSEVFMLYPIALTMLFWNCDRKENLE